MLAIAACVSLIGATAAGCATPATSAAQVGDTAISESVIFDRTTAVVEQVQAQGDPAPDAATLAELNRRQTTSAIRSKLLEVAANDVGVAVTDEQVNAALADDTAATAASQLGAPQTMVDQTVRDLLRLEGLVATQPAAGAPITNVVVSVDGVSVPTRDEAVATRSQFLADPSAVDGLIAASASPVQPDLHHPADPDRRADRRVRRRAGRCLALPESGRLLRDPDHRVGPSSRPC